MSDSIEIPILSKEYYRRYEVADILCVSPNSAAALFRRLGIKKRANKYFKQDVERVLRERKVKASLNPKRILLYVPEKIEMRVRELVKKEIQEYKNSLIIVNYDR